MRKLAAILIAVLLFAGCGFNNAETRENTANSDINLYREVIGSQITYIKKIQLENGAIPLGGYGAEGPSGSVSVMPYFSTFACLGLLEDESGYGAARNYIRWHFAHINTEQDAGEIKGTIYDYEVNLETMAETPTYDYDSTDSYAALFISLLRKYYEKTKDADLLIENKELIEIISKAIIATEDNGLTWAIPKFNTKYAMDNAEVIAGLNDAIWLYENVLPGSGLEDFFAEKKLLFEGSFENLLWDGQTDRMYYSAYEGQTPVKTDLTVFYPDAVCQLWPALFGVIPPECERARMLYSDFNENFPDWTELDFNGQDDFPWAVLSTAAVKMGDYKRAGEYIKAAKLKFIDAGNEWPWYCAEAGHIIIAASALIRDTLKHIPS